MQNLQAKLKVEFGINFHDSNLLRTAFTHSSYTHEEQLPKTENNERLEFLGDAALSLIISEYLYKKYPKKLEGELSKIRSSIVRTESLADFSRNCGFGEFLLLGIGEERMGGRSRETNLENLFEAFLGALLLDSGFESVKEFLFQVVIPKVETGNYERVVDYKTELQEVLQLKGTTHIIEYRVLDQDGPAHQLEFHVAVFDNNLKLGEGSGRSKKLAEQKAAENAIRGQLDVS